MQALILTELLNPVADFAAAGEGYPRRSSRASSPTAPDRAGKIRKPVGEAFQTSETTKPALGGLCRCFEVVGRGNLKQIGIYLFFLVNNLFVNLLGIPVGTLRGLDSDGRCFLSSVP
ncbi:hypothetical protein [Pseudomonas sp.]|uniref:hypothetical protein n=1 Tax=Pseudomonas sp. TaxID=306 RepID=UPI003C662857